VWSISYCTMNLGILLPIIAPYNFTPKRILGESMIATPASHTARVSCPRSDESQGEIAPGALKLTLVKWQKSPQQQAVSDDADKDSTALASHSDVVGNCPLSPSLSAKHRPTPLAPPLY
jgi:hypothetical protein